MSAAAAAAKVRDHQHLGCASRDHFEGRGCCLRRVVLTSDSDSYSFVNHPDDLILHRDAGCPQICSLATTVAAASATRGANNCSPWRRTPFPEAGRVAVVVSLGISHPLVANCESCLFYFI